MKALILAAGFGTRMGALTRLRPKPMLPVAGQPLLAYLIFWLRLHGIEQIAVNLHHAPHIITKYLDSRNSGDVELIYSFEHKLLGSAGAAKKLETFFDEPFVVVYGDVFTNLDLGKLIACHRQNMAQSDGRGAMTLSLYRVPEPTQCGIVDLDTAGRIVRFVEKPPPEQVFSDLAFSGVLVCEPEILRHIPAETAFDFGQDLLPNLIEKGDPVFGVPIAEREFCIDIGTLPGYFAALRKAQVGMGLKLDRGLSAQPV